MDEMLSFYRASGRFTDPGAYADLLGQLPREIPALVAAVQGLQEHIFWLGENKALFSQERQQSELNMRAAQDKLERILALDPAPLNQPRPLERRLLGNCRDFSVLMVTFLRAMGVAARARCGFGAYFMPDHFEDHWVVEYWNVSEARWVAVDAQLTPFQQQVLHLDFDPLDIPPGKFISGGEAWRMCRRGGQDPEKFGIFEMNGWDFIRGDLLRDVLALNNIEILPWDMTAAMQPPYEQLDAARLEALDRLAEASAEVPDQHPEDTFNAIRALYLADPSLQPQG
jgi:hypothetical protein